MNKDGCIYLIIGKTAYLILDRLEATTLAIIITTITVNSPQTTPKTKTEGLSLLHEVRLSYFSTQLLLSLVFQAPHVRQLPSAEFQKAEIVLIPPNAGTGYKELRMPIILQKQMDILDHKHLRTMQMLQFWTKYGNRSWPFFVSFHLNEGICQGGGTRKRERILWVERWKKT